MDLQLHDILELKKDHPCGSRRWEVLRVGMDIKLKCLGCGHEVMQPRRKVEKMIKKLNRRRNHKCARRQHRSLWASSPA